MHDDEFLAIREPWNYDETGSSCAYLPDATRDPARDLSVAFLDAVFFQTGSVALNPGLE